MQPTLELKTTRYEVSGGIATLTLSRPHRHNAWTGRMHTEYRHLLACADADPEVRVVVVTGEGRAFCVGGDSQALDGHALASGLDAYSAKGDEYVQLIQQMIRRLDTAAVKQAGKDSA